MSSMRAAQPYQTEEDVLTEHSGWVSACARHKYFGSILLEVSVFGGSIMFAEVGYIVYAITDELQQ